MRKTSKRIAVIVLGLILIAVAGWFLWANQHIAGFGGSGSSETGNGTHPRLVYFGSGANSSTVIVSDLDGSNQKIFPIPASAGRYSDAEVRGNRIFVQAWGAAGNTASVWMGDPQGNFSQVSTFNYSSIDANANIGGATALSPDASIVAFTKAASSAGTRLQLWEQNLKTQSSTLLADHLEQYTVTAAGEPFTGIVPFAFSPDGGTLYLSYDFNGGQYFKGYGNAIFALDMATQQLKKIPLGGADLNIGEMHLSPDGSMLAFVPMYSNNAQAPLEVYRFVDGTTRTFSGYDGTGFTWAPDNRHVAYADTKSQADYLDTADGSVHVVGIINQGLPYGNQTMFWVSTGTLVYAYNLPMPSSNGTWDEGIGMITSNASGTGATSTIIDSAQLVGIVWE